MMTAQFRRIQDRRAGGKAGAYSISRVRALCIRLEDDATQNDKSSEESEQQGTTFTAWQI
jgi:hypothetical protein